MGWQAFELGVKQGVKLETTSIEQQFSGSSQSKNALLKWMKNMSFLNSLDTFGKGQNKLNSSFAKPPAERFVTAALQEIAAIESSATSRNWFTCTKNGEYQVTLRNGIAVMPVGGMHRRVCATAEIAVDYLKAAMAAAEAGELDEAFAKTQLKFKRKG